MGGRGTKDTTGLCMVSDCHSPFLMNPYSNNTPFYDDAVACTHTFARWARFEWNGLLMSTGVRTKIGLTCVEEGTQIFHHPQPPLPPIKVSTCFASLAVSEHQLT
jgi:hypothetical protein